MKNPGSRVGSFKHLKVKEDAARQVMQEDKPFNGRLAGLHIANQSKPIRSLWHHPLAKIIRWALAAWGVVIFAWLVLVALG